MLTQNSRVLIMVALLTAPPGLTFAQCTLNVAVEIVQPDCGEVANGSITMTPSSGSAPFIYYLNGAVTGAVNTGLIAGIYDCWVQDSQNCWFKGSAELVCKEEENCQFRSQTQGGWGATPNGNNPAMYLQNHWTSCFPNGITVGCASNNTLTLTSSTAVKNFLPSGSTPSVLPSDKVNPGGTYNNVLAGQLVAAVINVTVDACDPDFSAATGWLGDVTYVGGPFAGSSVMEVIDLANDFIGGCGGSYTASQFNEALTMLNENYLGGTIDNGNFDCSGKKDDKKMMSAPEGSFNLYPNPAMDSFKLAVDLQNAGNGTLYVLDLAGRVVVQQAIIATEAGPRTIAVNVERLSAGTYTASLLFDGRMTSSHFVVTE